MLGPIDPRAAPAMANADDRAKRAEVARQFEAVFLTETVQQMLKDAGKGAIGSSDAEKTWNGFLAQAIADKIAASGTTGIAQSVERMLGAYGAAPPTPSREGDGS